MEWVEGFMNDTKRKQGWINPSKQDGWERWKKEKKDEGGKGKQTKVLRAFPIGQRAMSRQATNAFKHTMTHKDTCRVASFASLSLGNTNKLFR